MQVYLARHGRTAWNAERKNQGHTDIPLDEGGIDQAIRLAEAFDDRPITRIITSDLQRAMMTAQPAVERFGIDLEIRPDLRERSFGEWEGLPMERVAANFLDLAQQMQIPKEEVRPPAGESLLDVWERIEPAARLIQASHEPILIVCHGGSGGALLARLLRATVLTAPAFRMDNTGLTTLAKRPDVGYQMIAYNDVSHLTASSRVAL